MSGGFEGGMPVRVRIRSYQAAVKICTALLLGVAIAMVMPGSDVALSQSGTGASPYTFTTIDVPNSGTTAAFGINNTGQIVGIFADATGGHGFLKNGGTFTTIDVPNAVPTSANGINNVGQIVGTFGPSNAPLPYVRDVTGKVTTINVPSPGGATAGYGINDAGQIVGAFGNCCVQQGFLGDVGGTITTFNPFNSFRTEAHGINNHGQIVGWYAANTLPFGIHGYVGGITIDVPNANGFTVALGINGNGQIVGAFGGAGGVAHGFLTDVGGTSFITIDVPNSIETQAIGINDTGQIVGTYRDARGIGHGFLANPVPQGEPSPTFTQLCSQALKNGRGDTISFTAMLFSIDVNENGEGEPLHVTIDGETSTYTVSDHNVQTTFIYVASAANEIIRGSGAFDGDETCSITAMVNPLTIYSPFVKELLRKIGHASHLVGYGVDIAGAACHFFCPPIAFSLDVGGITIYIAASAVERAARDPSDTNFTVIAAPNIVSIPPLVPGGTLTPAMASQLNALLANQAAVFEIGTAAATSADRAQGAHDAGNSFWEGRQVQAAQLYASELGSLFTAQADILNGLHDALVASGFSLNVAPADVLNFEQQVAANGLPASWVQVLTELGASQDLIDQIRQLLIVQDVNAASGNFPDVLVSRDLIAALRNAAAALPPVGIQITGTAAPQISRITFPGEVTFAAFGARLAINSPSRAFEVNSTFILDAGGTISPVMQPVTIQVGNNFLAVIPAGSFRPGPNGKFLFDGVINGVALSANLTPLGGNSYAFRIEGAGAPNLPSANPVEVWLGIGNNGGSVPVNAGF